MYRWSWLVEWRRSRNETMTELTFGSSFFSITMSLMRRSSMSAPVRTPTNLIRLNFFILDSRRALPSAPISAWSKIHLKSRFWRHLKKN